MPDPAKLGNSARYLVKGTADQIEANVYSLFDVVEAIHNGQTETAIRKCKMIAERDIRAHKALTYLLANQHKEAAEVLSSLHVSDGE